MVDDKTCVFKIINISQETPEVKTFTLEIPQSINFKFLPGQYVEVSFHDNSKEQRKDEWKGFSISSSPIEEKYLDITVLNSGPFSQKMHDLQTGSFLRVKGPYGNFVFDGTLKKNPVFIAGGVGITPIMSMMRYIVDKNISYLTSLIYSSKSIKDILFYEDLKKMETEHGNVKCIYVLTQPDESKWSGHTGRINEEMIVGNIENILNNIYYICGPYEMMLMVSYILQKLGVRNSKIKTDLW